MDKILIIDGHNLLFRMYYGIPNPIYDNNGKDIRGVIGFVGSLLKAIKIDNFDKMIVVFDSESSSNNRVTIDNEYKNNRIDYAKVNEDENPFSQLDNIYKILKKLKIEFIEVLEHEADDYIASLCNIFNNDEVLIYSTDRDFLQLVNDKITLYCPRGKQSIEFDPIKIKEKYNVTPNRIIDFKVLVGDPCDNIKGVKTIGKKTAAKILKKGSLEDIIVKKIEIEEKIYHKISDNMDLIYRNKNLISMKKDISIDLINLDLSINFNKNLKTKEILEFIDIFY